MEKKRVIVVVSDGNVQDVIIPSDCDIEVEIQDYDNGENGEYDSAIY